jgi:hypothetical protein
MNKLPNLFGSNKLQSNKVKAVLSAPLTLPLFVFMCASAKLQESNVRLPKKSICKRLTLPVIFLLVLGVFIPLVALPMSPFQIPLVHATTLFSDNFESGNINAWSGSQVESPSTQAVVTSPVISGTYCLNTYLASGWHPSDVNKSIASTSHVNMPFDVIGNALPSANGDSFWFATISSINAQNNKGVTLGWQNISGVVYWVIHGLDAGGNVWIQQNSTVSPVINTLYNVELELQDGASGYAKLYLNGNPSPICNSGTVNIETPNEVFIGGYDYPGATSVNFYFDNVVVADAYIGVSAPSVMTYLGNNNYEAANGTGSSIQEAVNTVYTNLTANRHGTVVIPSGTYSDNYTMHPVVITAGINVTGTSVAGCLNHNSNWTHNTAATILNDLDIPTSTHAYGTVFYVDGYDNRVFAPSVTISNIEFNATEPTSATNENSNCGGAIQVRQNYDFRIENCTFLNWCNSAVFISANDGANATATCYGVVSNCVFDDPYKTNGGGAYVWGYDIICVGNIYYDGSGNVVSGHSAWNSNASAYFGDYGQIGGSSIAYVQDCHFSDYRHAISCTSGGFVCSRFDLFDTPACSYTAGTMDVHGAAFPSGRGVEAYNNTIIGAVNNQSPWSDTYYSLAFSLRGGSSLIFNNTFICPTNSASNIFAELTTGDYVANLGMMNISDTCIWSNTYTNCTFSSVDVGIVQNVDYWLSAPTNGYASNTYPEPTLGQVYLVLTNQYTITVTSAHGNPTSSGTVTQGGSFPTSVTSPVSGGTGIQYVCTGYSIDGGGSTAGTSYTFTNVQANHTITYSWQTQYYLTVSSTEGTTSGSGWYNSGAIATASVTPSVVVVGTGSQYMFNSWSYDSGTNNASDSVTMNTFHTDTASWILTTISFSPVLTWSYDQQTPGTNASYPYFWFYQAQGSNSVYGFYASGCNVTVTNYFVSDFLQFTTDGAGTVEIYTGSSGTPSLITGASGVFDPTLSVAILTVASAGQVQLNFGNNNAPPTGGGSTGGGSNFASTSTGFVVDAINLGTIYPNSTVSVSLGFVFAGSSFTLQSLTLSEPFESWLVPNNSFNQYIFIQTTAAETSGNVTLTFNIPAYITASSFSGTITVAAKDAFGVTHTSSAKISAAVSGTTVSGWSDWSSWLRNHPLYVMLIAVVVIAILGVVAVFSKRRAV